MFYGHDSSHNWLAWVQAYSSLNKDFMKHQLIEWGAEFTSGTRAVQKYRRAQSSLLRSSRGVKNDSSWKQRFKNTTNTSKAHKLTLLLDTNRNVTFCCSTGGRVLWLFFGEQLTAVNLSLWGTDVPTRQINCCSPRNSSSLCDLKLFSPLCLNTHSSRTTC